MIYGFEGLCYEREHASKLTRMLMDGGLENLLILVLISNLLPDSVALADGITASNLDS